MTQQPVLSTEISNWLQARGVELNARLQEVRADHARTDGPLSPDTGDRAIGRENDDVVDAIVMRTESELMLVKEALGRIEAGTFGLCLECDSLIGEERLRAVPYASRCRECSSTRAR